MSKFADRDFCGLSKTYKKIIQLFPHTIRLNSQANAQELVFGFYCGGGMRGNKSTNN